MFAGGLGVVEFITARRFSRTRRDIVSRCYCVVVLVLFPCLGFFPREKVAQVVLMHIFL